MFGDKTLKETKKVVQEFFKQAGFEAGITAERKENQKISVKITTEEPKRLIGQRGETLLEIQRLIRAIIRKKTKESFYLDLDINEYKEKKDQYLKETVRSLADEVALSQEEKALPPMSSYQRRIIHLELADRKDVSTKSVGEGADRKIIIIPSSGFNKIL
jgi:spoIIIJ-associated protein